MKIHIYLLTTIILNSCFNSNESKKIKELEEVINQCEYLNDFKDLGNQIIDTVRVGKRLIDPIDDFINFEKTTFDFLKREEKIYKKSKTHRNCNGKNIDIEYFQDFTNQIDLNSYREYNDTYFATKNRVNFWWVNSDGHIIIPIINADPKTFKQFEKICGGTDKNGIYYGCPNYGVYKLDIPLDTKFEFIAKEDNYWNSPSHYLIIDNKVYDLKYELKKGYFCERNKTLSVNEIIKLKNKKH